MAKVDSPHSFAEIILMTAFLAGSAIFGLWGAPALYSMNLIQQPLPSLRCALAILLPAVLLTFSSPPLRRTSLTRWRAIRRGLWAMLPGTLIAAMAAFAFGVPFTLESVTASLHWAALASTLIVVPMACVVGLALEKWRRVFAFARPVGLAEVMAGVPAHGAAIGSWLGTMPMPLDWEKPWQVWPVCCSYGTVGGFLIGLCVAAAINFPRQRFQEKHS